MKEFLKKLFPILVPAVIIGILFAAYAKADQPSFWQLIGNRLTPISSNYVVQLGSLSSDPSTGYNGQTYYNTTSNTFRCYVNNSWASCAGSSGGVSSFNTRTGVVTLQSSDVVSALGYTPYDSANPANYITSSALSPYLLSSTASSTYYLQSNPANYITSSALSGYLATSGATLGGTSQDQNFTNGIVASHGVFGTQTYVTGTGTNSLVYGHSHGSGYTISATNTGSFAGGDTDDAFGGGGATISSTGPGSSAIGYAASVFGTAGHILASGAGSFAGGDVTGGTIQATANGAFAFGGGGLSSTAGYSISFGTGFTNSLGDFEVGYGSSPTLHVNNNGVGIFTTPAAKLTIGASDGTYQSAPIDLTSGTLLSTPQDGALEYGNSHLYFTIGSTRYQIDQQGGGGGSSYWTSSGSYLYNNTGTYVGINTSTPNAQFEVYGNGSDNPFSVVSNGGSANSLAVGPSGDVGIGTGAPSGLGLYLADYSLVDGGINIGASHGQITIHANNSNPLNLFGDGGVTINDNSDGSGVNVNPNGSINLNSATDTFIQPIGGNVGIGIGTSAPPALLSVGTSSAFQVNTAGNITDTPLASSATQCLQANSSGVISGTGSACATGSSSGTVTNFSFTNGGGFTGTVTNASTTPTLSLVLQNATTSQSGQLTSTDWNTFNNKQSALTFSTGLTNTSGTVTVNTTQNIGTLSNITTAGFLQSTASGVLSSAALTSTQVNTALGYVPYNSLNPNNYISSNQNITLSGAVTGSGTTAITTTLASGIVGISNLSATGTPSSSTYLRGDNTWATISTSSGTVTSVSLTAPSFLSVSGSPVTTSGTLAISLATQSANTVFAGPTTGSAAIPTFRAIVPSDIPTLNQNTTGNAGTVTNGVYTTGSYANPSWITAIPYSILSGTVPTWNQNTTGSAASFTGSLIGDVVGTQSTTVVQKINGVKLSTLSTGILKNTTGTGAPSIAVGDTDYQNPITLTTTGTSGAATFSGDTLNIPQYSGMSYSAGAGLTLTSGVFSVNTTQNIGTLSNITTAGFLQATSSGVLSSAALTSGQVTTALGFTPYNATNPSGYITSSSLSPYLLSSTASSTYYLQSNPNGYITSSALSPYLTSATAASTYYLQSNPSAYISNVTGLISAGTNISISGSGTSASPYVINSTNSGGTVTTLSVTSENGFAGTVANSTTTPSITLSTSVTGLIKGNGTALSAAVAGTDYQSPITLTTTGTSGAATFSGGTLNIPQYSGNTYTAGTGLTLTGGAFSVNASQNITTLSNLTTAGFVQVNSSGVLSSATLTSAQVTAALGFTPGTGNGSVTSVGLSLPSIFSVTGTPITSSGTLTATLGSESANTFFAGPSTGSGTPTFRAIVSTDIPTLNQNTTGSAASFTGSLLGDVTGTQGATLLSKINGVSLSGLGTGILKITSGTPSLAVNTDLPVMTATQSGAVPTPPNSTTVFLRGDGTWASPSTSSTYQHKDAISGTQNGSNRTFTISSSVASGSDQLFENGLLLNSGSGNDYTISGTTITLSSSYPAPKTTDTLIFYGTY